MYDSIPEILDKLSLGEDSTIEFKSVRFKGDKVELSRESLADEISAFANTSDGVILFGIDDKSRTVEGIPESKLEAVETILREILHDSINPPVAARILKMRLPDTTGALLPIIKMDIPKSLFVHKGPTGYYRRDGSSKREIPPEALARLFQQRSQARIIRFDEQPVPETSIAQLDDALWHRFANISSEAPEVLMEKLKIITKDDAGKICLTVSGVLFCTNTPQEYLPNAKIEAVAYKGVERDSNYQLDARQIVGPLDSQILEALQFVKRNMRIMAVKSPGRIETPQFSIRAVFETIVNAVAHRDYSIHGSKIRLFLFSDRLEIYSPGMIPNSMTIDSLQYRQSTRNELITSLLSKCRFKGDDVIGRQAFLEKRGEGIPIILSESLTLSHKEPKFRLIDDAELLLTIFSAEHGAV